MRSQRNKWLACSHENTDLRILGASERSMCWDFSHVAYLKGAPLPQGTVLSSSSWVCIIQPKENEIPASILTEKVWHSLWKVGTQWRFGFADETSLPCTVAEECISQLDRKKVEEAVLIHITGLPLDRMTKLTRTLSDLRTNPQFPQRLANQLRSSQLATRQNFELTCFTLYPAFALVSMNITFNSFAFRSPSSVDTFLKESTILAIKGEILKKWGLVKKGAIAR